ncbi:hypothetical protein C474_10109 [Halogeometricum pallidum JCM 14848]|uniref:Fenitrothion hydrolase n=1 Tax=Halogeometricum pallidum JCM 14848 TaxID=1227487 RepID=M0DAI0_HALPD|nr:hypothetical protein [Halogeometricum pallidum]ELZ31179.1 hypothetical protein C474_10109 [Halogeometricum pallidum JCM 14848]
MRGRVPYRSAARVVVAVAAFAFAARPVAAHQLSTRFDAPVPLGLLYAGAGVTVALTAVLVARLDSTPERTATLGAIPRRFLVALRSLGRVGFLLVCLAVLLHGLFGPRAPGENLATLVTWAIWLKGVALVSILLGSPWRILSPWRTVYEGLCRLEGEPIRVRRYPDRLGDWPALIGFVLLVGVVENLTRIPQLPEVTAVVVASYGLVMVLGAFVFGRAWLDHADPLAVFYRLLGRVAPVGSRETDRGTVELTVRYPWQACSRPLDSRTAAAFVVAMVYTVTFDGFAESPIYRDLYFGAQEALGVGGTVSILLYCLGLLGFVGCFAGVTALVDRLLREGVARTGAGRSSRAESDGGSVPTISLVLAPTLLPIAAGYEFAHTFSYVLTYAGRLPRVAGLDPIDPLWWLSLPSYWGMQVCLIVAGHVVAVVAADAVTRRRAPTERWALIAHAPLVALMVGYTVLSLWVISLPVAA